MDINYDSLSEEGKEVFDYAMSVADLTGCEEQRNLICEGIITILESYTGYSFNSNRKRNSIGEGLNYINNTLLRSLVISASICTMINMAKSEEMLTAAKKYVEQLDSSEKTLANKNNELEKAKNLLHSFAEALKNGRGREH